MMLSDAPAMAHVADGVILVIRSRTTARPTILKAVHQLQQVGAKISGAVLNCHNISGESYYYHSYYRDYYNRYYGTEDKGKRGAVG
jgi:Mrp family chromosome partitioning ATPase